MSAYSSSAELLIATRALLGVAGATLMPSTMALVRNMFHDPNQRRTALGISMAGFTGGIAVGPLVGGLLLEHFWWGSVFLINVPVMVLLVALGPRSTAVRSRTACPQACRTAPGRSRARRSAGPSRWPPTCRGDVGAALVRAAQVAFAEGFAVTALAGAVLLGLTSTLAAVLLRDVAAPASAPATADPAPEPAAAP